MSTNNDKHQKIERVYRYLRRSPGAKASEIAETLRLERRSVDRYLDNLEKSGRIYKDSVRWFAQSDEPLRLKPVNLNADEGLVLYLAARLFVKQSDRRNLAAENALAKLADVLITNTGLSVALANAADELAQRPLEPGYADIFRHVAESYLNHHKLRITYHPYSSSRSFETVICPYLLEPSGFGLATYVIGHSSIVNDIRTYKLERITSAETLSERYSIPDDFDGIEHLKHAWSIYAGDTPIRVVLRFHPSVVRRLKESQWHSSQSPLTADPEAHGYVRLSFEIADTTDLKPWIRGWGAACEVLEPSDLRAEMIGEARKLAELYGISSNSNRSRYEDIF